MTFFFVFRTDSIVLSRHMIHDGNTLVILFTEEYGKIACWWKHKKPFPHDVGDIIETIIERKNSINIFRSVEAKSAPYETSWSYAKIFLFLQSLSLLGGLLPEMMQQRSLFQDYRGFVEYMHGDVVLDEHHYLLFRLRILRSLGYVNQEFFMESPVLQYIFHEVTSSPLGKILQSKPLKMTDEKVIERASWEAIQNSLS